MDHFDHGVAVGNGQRAAGTEIILYVDDQEHVLRGNLHRFSPLPLSQMNAASKAFSARFDKKGRGFGTDRAHPDILDRGHT
jgi:hypothetical protein